MTPKKKPKSRKAGKKVKTRAPRDARTLDDLCALTRDTVTYGEFWALTDGHTVTLARQRVGEAAAEIISIPRRTFNLIVNWYTKPQRVRRQP